MDLRHHQLDFGTAVLDTWSGACFCGVDIQYSFVMMSGSTTHHIFKLKHGHDYVAAQQIDVDRELVRREDEAMTAYNMLVATWKGLYSDGLFRCDARSCWTNALYVAREIAGA